VTKTRITVAGYAYSLLHIFSWWIWVSSSDTEPWSPAFSWLFGVLFLPLNLLTAGICRLVWGSLDIFRANLVIGLVTDVAVASLLSATILVGALIWWKGRADGAMQGTAPPDPPVGTAHDATPH
jgi:hypothetical protein